jgi:hypothetical protein
MNVADAARTAIPRRQSGAPAPAESTRFEDPGACFAYGCPCRGTSGDGGRFSCPWHVGQASNRIAEVTTALIANRGLIDAIGEMQRLHRIGGKSAPWIAYAQRFWQAHPADMAPTELERRHWNFYLWRMREHLAFLVGVREVKPQPLEPQCREPAFATANRYRGSEA